MDSINEFTAPVDGRKGGYIVNLKSKVPEKWLCPLCNLLMKDAIQTYRGEVACESCFMVAKGDGKVCPLDGEPIDDGEFFKDRHTRRVILNLECYCVNKENGCDWEGVVQHYEDHTLNCTYKIINCGYCNESVMANRLVDHQQNFCLFRKVACQYCNILLDVLSLKEHEPTCHMKPVECPYMCGDPIQLNDLYTHVEKCSKITSGRICPYGIVGCKHKVNNADELDAHLHIDMAMHAALTVSIVKTFQENSEKMQQALREEQASSHQLDKKVKEQRDIQKTLVDELATWKEKFAEMEKERAKLQDMCNKGVEQVTRNLNQMNRSVEENSLREIDTKLTEVGRKYEEVERKLKNEGIPHASGFNAEEAKQGAAKIDKLESGSAVLTANLAELELKLQLLENTCYEGRQLWKIDNVAYRRNHAITGSVSALHSAPCFQKRGGYKFCSRLYLNGDGMGRATHVSLFFVVMKSEYDALLEWPFSERVTFRLINPYNPDESVKESFIPDKNSSSFKRPTKDMNIAAGCPLFLRQDLLPNFIIDDTLYIETSIGNE